MALLRGLALAGLPERSDAPAGIASVSCGEAVAAPRQPAPGR
ncbi:hypothetical protein [Roseicella frigidaeris]|nr:hypothetical protein [Roseicella frigidaeris]